MSNYTAKTIHPELLEYREAYFIDDYFGSHNYGIQFVGESRVYNETEIASACDIHGKLAEGVTEVLIDEDEEI